MMDILISILLVIIGLIGGFVFTTVFNSLRENNVNKRIEALMEKAKKDAEKAKRDSILETKEEIHKLKLDYDKELKEKIFTGEIEDAKTVASLMAYAVKYEA